MKVAIIVQARIHSTRLPRKALLDICGKTALERVVERCAKVASADEVVVACPKSDEVPIFERTGIIAQTGPEHDLVTRLLNAARHVGADKFVRVTGDCPLIDPDVLQRCISLSIVTKDNVIANWIRRSYPNGMDCEVYDTRWFEQFSRRELSLTDREWFPVKIAKEEHVRNVEAAWDASSFRLTLDYVEDLTLLRQVQGAMGDSIWGWERICLWLREHPKVLMLNAKYAKETGGEIR